MLHLAFTNLTSRELLRKRLDSVKEPDQMTLEIRLDIKTTITILPQFIFGFKKLILAYTFPIHTKERKKTSH